MTRAEIVGLGGHILIATTTLITVTLISRRPRAAQAPVTVPDFPPLRAGLSDAETRACHFVHVVSFAKPSPGNTLDQVIVETARKVAADLQIELRRSLSQSPSGIPTTRSKA